MFFICHSPVGTLAAKDRRDVHVWTGAPLSEPSMPSMPALFGYLMDLRAQHAFTHLGQFDVDAALVLGRPVPSPGRSAQGHSEEPLRVSGHELRHDVRAHRIAHEVARQPADVVCRLPSRRASKRGNGTETQTTAKLRPRRLHFDPDHRSRWCRQVIRQLVLRLRGLPLTSEAPQLRNSLAGLPRMTPELQFVGRNSQDRCDY